RAGRRTSPSGPGRRTRSRSLLRWTRLRDYNALSRNRGAAARVLAAEVISAHEFERIVEDHQHRIFGFALGLSGNRSDAEEIAQDAFVRAHRALQGYDEERVRDLRVSAWLHQIALNVFRNRVR